MSVSDPLLKSLKHEIIRLCVVNTDDRAIVTKDIIDDDNVGLQSLCVILEEILRKGLYRVGGMFNLEYRDYWNWLHDLPKLIKQNNNQNSKYIAVHSRYEDCLNLVQKYGEKAGSLQGKGRLMIRALLQNKILHWPIEMLCFTLKEVNSYYSDFNSLMGNEILSQMLISQLSQLSVINFKLNLKNCMFLSESWIMPTLKDYEFVPCKQLGVNLITVDAYQIIEKLQKGSVAEEENYLESGDVLDELFGNSLKWCKYPLKEIMQANNNLPVRLSVIKLRMVNGCIFPPIHRLLRKANLLTLIQGRCQNSGDFVNQHIPKTIHDKSACNNSFPSDLPSNNPNMAPNYGLKYVGSTYVGSYGGVSKIEAAIAETLKHYNNPTLYVPVYIDLGEKDLTVRQAQNLPKNEPSRDPNNGEASTVDQTNGNDDDDDEDDKVLKLDQLPVLFSHAYPQISSCGRRVDCTRFLAYIVGETTCTISRHFVCHVFESRSESESKTILTTIAQGFERTHWTI